MKEGQEEKAMPGEEGLTTVSSIKNRIRWPRLNEWGWPLEAGRGKEEVLPSNLGRGKALPTQ